MSYVIGIVVGCALLHLIGVSPVIYVSVGIGLLGGLVITKLAA